MTYKSSIWRLIGLLILSMYSLPAVFADDPPPQKEPAPRETPLGKFFDRLFDGVNEPQPEEKEPLPIIEASPRITPDAIDERAMAGRQQRRELIQAQRQLIAGEQSTALAILQQLLDAEEDTLILSPDGHWKSLQQTAEGVIAGGERELQRAYIERFGPVAERQLRQAKLTGRLKDYARVASRFLMTPAGQESARILATLFRDAGDATEAAYWEQRARRSRSEEPPTEVSKDSQSTEDGLQTHRTVAEDWPQPFGGPAHRGVFESTEPVLIERWATPIAVRPAVAEQVAELVQDLRDNHQACISSAMPLAVDGRIISRTLRGLSVYDADDGRQIWESAEGISVERLLQGDDIPKPGGEPTGRRARAVPAYRGTNPDGHPLGNLLFRDGVYGLVSSDGEQVFVLEEHASLSYRQPGYFWGRRVEDDPFDRDWKTNRLIAYGLVSGDVRWRVGGQRLNDPFDLPLEGMFFLGPPVVDGDELFIIGERDGTVFLNVLDRASGELLWEHAISDVGAAIEQDLVRRWWPAQPAVGRGVIVCPTTAGWLVAIDRLQRRIRWTYRYIEARQKKVSSNRPRVAATGPLNARWCPAAPVMTQRHVVYTPPELPDPLYGDNPVVVGLDLLTGERVFREEKGDNLYLGSVIDERVILVGKESIEAWHLTKKKRLWETPFNLQAANITAESVPKALTFLGDTGPPSGRGIVVGDSFLVPLQSGQLWTVSLSTGDVESVASLRSDERPLGNLLVHDGRLISAGPFEIRCFEERSTIASAVSQSDASQSVESRLRAAELQFTEGDLAAARQTLHQLQKLPLNESQQRQADGLLWETLLTIVKADLGGADEEFLELTQLALGDEQQLTIERVRADRLLARGEREAAFEVYWQHARQPRSAYVEEMDTSIRFDHWLSGRLRSLWESAAEPEKAKIDERISTVLEDLTDEDDSGLRWWAEVLRFHSAGARLRQKLADQAFNQQHWASAEIYLLQLIEEFHDDEIKTWALERLLTLMLDQNRSHDALTYLRRYRGSVSGSESVAAAFTERLPHQSRIPIAGWSEGSWTLTRTPATFKRTMFEPALAVAADVPSVDRLMFRLEPTLHRLSLSTFAGEPVWETPLQAQSQSFYNQTTGLASIGQLMFVVHRGVLHGISIADRELLWQQKFDVRSATAGYVRGPTTVRQQELRERRSFVWSDGLRQTRTPMGMLAAWKPGYIVYFGRHSITLADPLTGQTIWKRKGIPPRTMVYGTSDVLYIVPPSSHDPMAVRVLDGSTIEMPGLNRWMSSAVGVNDRGLLLIEQSQAFRLFGWGDKSDQLKLVDTRTRETLWSTEFPVKTRFARLDSGEIVTVTPSGEIQLVDIASGDPQPIGQMDDGVMENLQRLFAVTERERIYLTFNQPPKPGSYSRSYQSVPVNGTLAAFDRQDGLLWTQQIDDQNLIVDQLSQLPVLVFSSLKNEREGNITSQRITVEVRDKQTGESLLDESRYIIGGNLRELEVDHPRQFIDLKTYNERLRLQVGED